MNREQAKELLPIITAFAEGKSIQYRDSYGNWNTNDDVSFALLPGRYRIKPEEVKVQRYGIVVRDSGEFLTTFGTKRDADNYVARCSERIVAFPMAGSYER